MGTVNDYLPLFPSTAFPIWIDGLVRTRARLPAVCSERSMRSASNTYSTGKERAGPVRSTTTRTTNGNDKWHSWLGFCLRRPLFYLGFPHLFLRHGFIPQTKVRFGIPAKPVLDFSWGASTSSTPCLRRNPSPVVPYRL